MITICENCQEKNTIIEDDGQVVCSNCGLIYDENVIVNEYEKRTFEGDDEQIKRVALPERPEQVAKRATVSVVSHIGQKKVVRTYTKQTKIDKNFKKIEHVLSLAGVTKKIIDITKELYSTMAPNKNMQGRNFNHIIIALYYYANIIEGQAKTFRQIEKIFPSVKERQIRKAFNCIKCYIVHNDSEDKLINIEKDYIRSYIGINQEKYESKMLSYDIITNINHNSFLEGKSPNTVAGISLLLSYRLLSDNSDSGEDFFRTFSNKATLSRAFEEIKCSLDKIIPQKYSDKIEMIKNSKI